MRQKITKMLLSMMLAMVCMLNMGIIAYADAEYDSGMTKEEVIAKYMVDTGNEQADKVFNEYLEVASEMMFNEIYAESISSWEMGEVYFEEFYVTYCAGTHEEWISKTTFEKMLLSELYVIPMVALTEFTYDSTFETVEVFLDEVCMGTYRTYEAFDAELAEAYFRIMEWQYYYIVENSAVYDFLSGKDSLGRTEIAEVTQFVVEESVEVPESSEANVEVPESSEEVLEVTEPQATEEPIAEEEKGIWDDTIQSLKEKWLTFLILGVLVIALAGVTIYRKSKAIDDDRVA